MARFGSTASIFGLNLAGAFIPIVTVTPSTTSVTEGGSVSFTVASNIISQNISYQVVTNPTNQNSWFNPSSSVTGTVTTNSSGGATITLATVNDLAFSVAKTFTVQILYNNIVVATSSSITINDSTTVSFSSPASSVNEGVTTTFNIITSNLSNTTLYWSIDLTGGITSGDFSATSGSFSITSGAGSFNITTADDMTTEGAESFVVRIRSDSISGTIRAQTTVSLADTSLTRTYAFGTIPTSINEGSSGTFNVSTTNVPNGTTLYWTLFLTGNMTASDFSAVTGSFTINSNTGSFTVSPLADATTEGAETFQVYIRTGSIGGTIVATSNSVTVNDTSVTPPTFSFISQPASINEDGSIGSFTLRASNYTGTLYWSLALASGLAEPSPAAPGTIWSWPNDNNLLASSSGSLTGFTGATRDVTFSAIQPNIDALTEGTEYARVYVYTSTPISSSGFVIASSWIPIGDTSITPLTKTVNFSNITYTGGVTIPNNPTLNRPVVVSGGTGSYNYSINSGSVNLSTYGISFDSATGIFSGTTTGYFFATAMTITITSGTLSTTHNITMTLNAGPGRLNFTTVGSTTFVVPPGITSISVLAIGGGAGGGGGFIEASNGNFSRSWGGGGGGGGGLRYYNGLAVTSGESLTVDVGARGLGGSGGQAGTGTGGVTMTTVIPNPGTAGGNSRILRSGSTIFFAGGGTAGLANNRLGTSGTGVTGSAGGTGTSTATAGVGGGNGGTGGNGMNPGGSLRVGGGGGGGGAGGYAGAGGGGGAGTSTNSTFGVSGAAGAGGGGGGGVGGGTTYGSGAGGGGTGINGQGTNGAGGTSVTEVGGGGSGGASGTSVGVGGLYGGGGSGGATQRSSAYAPSGRSGQQGAIVILWPGTRTWPTGA
jgi:hypothetical protein